MKNELILTILVLIPLLCTGCATQDPENSYQPLFLSPDRNKQKTLQTAQTVLEDMNFTIEKADSNAGIVRTRPLSGADLLEFWRKDAANVNDLMYSSIHSIQKFAQIEFLPAENQSYKLNCIVEVQRLAMPPRSITGFDDLPVTFSKSSTSRQRLALADKYKKQMSWVYDGNDEKLQSEILKRIKKRLNRHQENK